jgi:hypothetical protein
MLPSQAPYSEEEAGAKAEKSEAEGVAADVQAEIEAERRAYTPSILIKEEVEHQAAGADQRDGEHGASTGE